MARREAAIGPEDLSGVLAILPTPATQDAGHWSCTMSVDLDECARMTHMIRDAGIRIMITGGSLSEGASLTDEEHVTLNACVAETLAGSGLLFAGATTLNTRDTIARARRLIDAGADGLFLGRPMWMSLDSEGIVRFYRDIAEALPGVPVIIYDNQFVFRSKIDTEAYRQLSRIPEIVGAKHIGGPSLESDARATQGRIRIMPVDSQWGANARRVPDLITACWSGNAADGPEPLAALAAAVAAGDFDLAELIGAHMAWAQAPMFPGGRIEALVDYNIPIVHGRLKGSGRVRSGPPRPPYTHAPQSFIDGGIETGRRWNLLRDRFPIPPTPIRPA